MWPFYCESQIEFVWIAHAKSLLERVVGRLVGVEGRVDLWWVWLWIYSFSHSLSLLPTPCMLQVKWKWILSVVGIPRSRMDNKDFKSENQKDITICLGLLKAVDDGKVPGASVPLPSLPINTHAWEKHFSLFPHQTSTVQAYHFIVITGGSGGNWWKGSWEKEWGLELSAWVPEDRDLHRERLPALTLPPKVEVVLHSIAPQREILLLGQDNICHFDTFPLLVKS